MSEQTSTARHYVYDVNYAMICDLLGNVTSVWPPSYSSGSFISSFLAVRNQRIVKGAFLSDIANNWSTKILKNNVNVLFSSKPFEAMIQL